MGRTPPEVSVQESADASLPARDLAVNSDGLALHRDWTLWLFRCCVAGAAAAVTLSLSPFDLHGWSAAGLGFALAFAIFLVEYRLRRSASPGLLGGAIGGLFGALAALLVSAVIARTSEPEPIKSFLEYASLLGFGYVGVTLGARKFASLKTGAWNGLFVFRSATTE